MMIWIAINVILHFFFVALDTWYILDRYWLVVMMVIVVSITSFKHLSIILPFILSGKFLHILLSLSFVISNDFWFILHISFSFCLSLLIFISLSYFESENRIKNESFIIIIRDIIVDNHHHHHHHDTIHDDDDDDCCCYCC